jgi:signal peptidase II
MAADQLTKLWVEADLSYDDSVHVLGPLDIVRVSNRYGAWGMRAPQPVWPAISFVAIIAMFFLYSRDFFASRAAGVVAIGLILGGTVSNLGDRLASGAVTDFIYIHLWSDVYWPAFNIADIAIVVGAILAVCTLLFTKKQPQRD